MSIQYPAVRSMFTPTTQSGAVTEGRQNRKGMGSMKIGSYTQDWLVNNFRMVPIQVDEVPMPVMEVRYNIKIRTFLPLSMIGDIKRYDTISWWLLTWQENLRHLGLASKYTQSPLWPTMKKVYASYFELIKDTWIKWMDFIIGQGDTSLKQWTFYVKEHKDSADPFGIGNWNDILQDERLLKLSWQKTLEWMREFRAEFPRLMEQGKQTMVKADFCYAGMRARPAEYTVLNKTDYDVTLYAAKWRDRKVGGIRGESQMTFPIFNNPQHKLADKIWHDLFRKILGVEVKSLSDMGPQMYVDLMNESKINLYDIKTAEKQVGLLFNDMPFSADLGYNLFPAEFAPEMYSGIGPTTVANELYQCIFLRAAMDEYQWSGKKWYVFSDNMAVDTPLPGQVHVDEADTFCGLNVKNQRFGPASLCTDNPKHRIALKGSVQHQSQRMQYIMRPFMAILLNSIDKATSCYKFLKYVADNKLMGAAMESEGARQDVIKELVEARQAGETAAAAKERHQHILDTFSDTAQFVRDSFMVQENDPDYSTDLMVETY